MILLPRDDDGGLDEWLQGGVKSHVMRALQSLGFQALTRLSEKLSCGQEVGKERWVSIFHTKWEATELRIVS